MEVCPSNYPYIIIIKMIINLVVFLFLFGIFTYMYMHVKHAMKFHKWICQVAHIFSRYLGKRILH